MRVPATFADGDATDKTVVIDVVDDQADERDETIELTFSTPTGGATFGSQAGTAVTILDDDPALIDVAADVCLPPGP